MASLMRMMRLCDEVSLWDGHKVQAGPKDLSLLFFPGSPPGFLSLLSSRVFWAALFSHQHTTRILRISIKTQLMVPRKCERVLRLLIWTCRERKQGIPVPAALPAN